MNLEQNTGIQKAGFIVQGVQHLSASETLDYCNNGAVLIDIRMVDMSRYKQFAVPEVLYIPFAELESKINLIPRHKFLIVADTTGIYSKEAIQLLIKFGFERLANLAGGFIDWERSGYPVRTNLKEQLSGSCMCQLKKRNK